MMNKPGNTPLHMLNWTSGGAIILFCLTGIASMMGWIPTGGDGPDTFTSAEETATSNGKPAPAECGNCGVIAATCVLDFADEEPFMAGLINSSGVLGAGFVEAIAGTTPPAAERIAGRHYQTTVRFGNGTIRAFADKSRPAWQVGDRVRVIKGVIQPQG